MRRTRQVNLRMPAHVHEQLKAIARVENTSMAALAEEALDTALRDRGYPGVKAIAQGIPFDVFSSQLRAGLPLSYPPG